MALDRRFLLCGFAYAIAGMGLGIYMAASHNHALFVAHAHMLLLGFVVSFIYALIHKLWLVGAGGRWVAIETINVRGVSRKPWRCANAARNRRHGGRRLGRRHACRPGPSGVTGYACRCRIALATPACSVHRHRWLLTEINKSDFETKAGVRPATIAPSCPQQGHAGTKETRPIEFVLVRRSRLRMDPSGN
ncbi:MAG: hypothetical protein J0I74_00605 [Rhodanobacter sp.]|nr:hypothetical protein [Rhodanobacter sp.]